VKGLDFLFSLKLYEYQGCLKHPSATIRDSHTPACLMIRGTEASGCEPDPLLLAQVRCQLHDHGFVGVGRNSAMMTTDSPELKFDIKGASFS